MKTVMQRKMNRAGGEVPSTRGASPLEKLSLDTKPYRGNELILMGEIATLFRVNSKTVIRYAQGGKFPEGSIVRTLGGHRRIYRWGVVAAILGQKNNCLTEREADQLIDDAKTIWQDQRAIRAQARAIRAEKEKGEVKEL